MALNTDDNAALVEMHDDFFKDKVDKNGNIVYSYFGRIDFVT